MTPTEKAIFHLKNELSVGVRPMQDIVDEYCAEIFKLGYEQSERHRAEEPHTCSDKAYVRVVDAREMENLAHADFIQVLCSCGHIISENEIKNK